MLYFILDPSAYGFGNAPALDPSPLHAQKSSGSRLVVFQRTFCAHDYCTSVQNIAGAGKIKMAADCGLQRLTVLC